MRLTYRGEIVMEKCLFWLQFDDKLARKRVDQLRSLGISVELETKDGAAAYRRIKASLPALVIADPTTRAAHVRETVKALKTTKKTREIEIVFISDDREILEVLRTLFPGESYLRNAELEAFLRERGFLSSRSALDEPVPGTGC